MLMPRENRLPQAVQEILALEQTGFGTGLLASREVAFSRVNPKFKGFAQVHQRNHYVQTTDINVPFLGGGCPPT